MSDVTRRGFFGIVSAVAAAIKLGGTAPTQQSGNSVQTSALPPAPRLVVSERSVLLFYADGQITKGMPVVLQNNGYIAAVSSKAQRVFGVALESGSDKVWVQPL